MVGGEALAGVGARIAARERHDPGAARVVDERHVEVGDIGRVNLNMTSGKGLIMACQTDKRSKRAVITRDSQATRYMPADRRRRAR